MHLATEQPKTVTKTSRTAGKCYEFRETVADQKTRTHIYLSNIEQNYAGATAKL